MAQLQITVKIVCTYLWKVTPGILRSGLLLQPNAEQFGMVKIKITIKLLKLRYKINKTNKKTGKIISGSVKRK